MAYALVTVENKEQRAWPEGLDFYVHKLGKDEGVKQIAESAWLIHLDTDLLVLAQIIVSAHKANMPYHALVTDQKPNLLSFYNAPKNEP